MAPAAGKVIGVEIVEEAVEAAKKNAAANGLDNCEFIAGDVLKVLDEVEEKPDMIILDPPQRQHPPKALPKIIAYGVGSYCLHLLKPTSLVRDLEVFLGERLPRGQGRGRGPIPLDRKCRDGCFAFQGRNRLEEGAGGVLAGRYGYVRLPEGARLMNRSRRMCWSIPV